MNVSQLPTERQMGVGEKRKSAEIVLEVLFRKAHPYQV